jgi:hypothetical protein
MIFSLGLGFRTEIHIEQTYVPTSFFQGVYCYIFVTERPNFTSRTGILSPNCHILPFDRLNSDASLLSMQMFQSCRFRAGLGSTGRDLCLVLVSGWLAVSSAFCIESINLIGSYGITDAAGTSLPANCLIRVGSFGGISDREIAELLSGDLATVRSNLNTLFSVGSNSLWGSTTVNAVFLNGQATLNRASTLQFGSRPVFVLVFNGTAINNSTQAGIFCYLNEEGGLRRAFPDPDSGDIVDLEFSSTSPAIGMRPFLGTLAGDSTYRLAALGAGFGITSPTTYAALTDSEVSYQITANHGPTSFSAANLPTGLAVGSSNGLISGSVATTGTYTITLRAAGLAGEYSSSLTLTVTDPLPGTPRITSSTNPQSATAGVAFSYLIQADNSPTSFSSANLPMGLSVNAGSGEISGTPTLPGTYTVAVGASNAIGPGKNSKFTLVVNQPSLSYTDTSFQLGTASTSPVPLPTSGYSPVTFRKPAGGNWDLVPGLDLDLATGEIMGTPTSAFAPVVLTVESLDASGIVGAGLATVSSATAKPVLNSASAVSGLTFSPIAYAVTDQVTGTTVRPGAYKLLRFSNSTTTDWVTASNTTVLPGVTLNETTGALSGSPSTGGTFLAEFAGDNSIARAGSGYSGSVYGGGVGTALQVTFTIDVTPPTLPVRDDASSFITVTDSMGVVRDYVSMPTGTTRSFDVAHNLATLTTFSNVPSWMRVRTNTTSAGSFATISGRATQAGSYTIVKLAQNINVAGVLQSTSRELVLTVVGTLPTAASAGFQAPPPGQVGQNYTGYVTAEGAARSPGDPNAFNAVGLPAGLSLASAADRQLGKISGVPTRAGRYLVKFYIANVRGYTTQTVTMNILP